MGNGHKNPNERSISRRQEESTKSNTAEKSTELTTGFGNVESGSDLENKAGGSKWLLEVGSKALEG